MNYEKVAENSVCEESVLENNDTAIEIEYADEQEPERNEKSIDAEDEPNRKYLLRKKYAEMRNSLIDNYAYTYEIYDQDAVEKILLDPDLRKYIRLDHPIEEKKMELIKAIKESALDTRINKLNIKVSNEDKLENYEPKDLELINGGYYFNYPKTGQCKKKYLIHLKYKNSTDDDDTLISTIKDINGNDKHLEVSLNKDHQTEIELDGTLVTLEVVTHIDSILKNIDLPFNLENTYGKYALKMDKYLLLIILIEAFGTSRTRLSRDMYRITATEAYRHLQYKTQVMLNSFSDDQTTRLIHSIAV